MKSAILFVLTTFTIITNASSVVCTSKDFDAAKSEGQSLRLTFTQNQLVLVEKLPGSWFCDSGKIVSPQVLSQTAAATVYDADFKCDESNARLVIPISFPSEKKIRYSFSDSESGSVKYELLCGELSK